MDLIENRPAFLTIILLCLYIILLFLERWHPLRKSTRSFLPRAFINISFTAVVYLTALLLISPLAVWALGIAVEKQFGLLPFLGLNPVFTFILGFLLMDLTFYYWHRINHEIPLLWRFHNVHHCDPDLDVTTSMRFHFVEIAYSSLFRVVQLGLIGLNPITFLAYEFAFQGNTFFHHSNVKLPLGLERLLNKVLVTPRMHGVHHSDYMTETNSNYSVVLSVWDRLHRTINLNVEQKKICIGVAAYLEKKDNRFWSLILMPFRPQRHYWQRGIENHKMRIESGLNEDKSLMLE